jgi:prolyl 4-hydroxylase
MAAQSSTKPAIHSARGLVPRAFCEYLIAVAAPRVRRARVNDAHQGHDDHHDMRTNSDASFGPADSDLIFALVEEKLAHATQVPRSHQEPTCVLRYRPGERYEDHFDFIDPAVPAFQHELETRGQRIVTALVYLNGDYEGGATDFPALGTSFRGNAGDAVWWRNVTRDGAPERRTLHAGRAPTRGEKWLLSKWVRDRRQPP